MTGEREALEALDNAVAEITRAQSERGPEDFCNTYHNFRKTVETWLPFIEAFPLFGKNVGEAVRFLMKLADVACPVP